MYNQIENVVYIVSAQINLLRASVCNSCVLVVSYLKSASTYEPDYLPRYETHEFRF